MTFSEYVQGWLEERQDLKPRTRVLYAGQLTVNATRTVAAGSARASVTPGHP